MSFDGRQSYQRGTVQVRLDAGLYIDLKVEAFARGKTIKELLDDIVREFLDTESITQGFRALVGGKNGK